jgi:hypothetical protein
VTLTGQQNCSILYTGVACTKWLIHSTLGVFNGTLSTALVTWCGTTAVLTFDSQGLRRKWMKPIYFFYFCHVIGEIVDEIQMISLRYSRHKIVRDDRAILFGSRAEGWDHNFAHATTEGSCLDLTSLRSGVSNLVKKKIHLCVILENNPWRTAFYIPTNWLQKEIYTNLACTGLYTFIFI